MTDYKKWSDRGRLDCYQDRCENVPFGSTGGLDERCNMQIPPWIADANRFQKLAYMEGYCSAALDLYGHDWMTTPFEWKKAITIEGNNE